MFADIHFCPYLLVRAMIVSNAIRRDPQKIAHLAANLAARLTVRPAAGSLCGAATSVSAASETPYATSARIAWCRARRTSSVISVITGLLAVEVVP